VVQQRVAQQLEALRVPASEAGYRAGAATAAATANKAAAVGCDGPAPKQAAAAAGSCALAEKDEDLGNCAGEHEPTARQAGGTKHDATVQRSATTDDAGAALEPKHDHARGVGRGFVTGGDKEQQREAQEKD
jgi:hypothetical protein